MPLFCVICLSSCNREFVSRFFLGRVRMLLETWFALFCVDILFVYQCVDERGNIFAGGRIIILFGIYLCGVFFPDFYEYDTG